MSYEDPGYLRAHGAKPQAISEPSTRPTTYRSKPVEITALRWTPAVSMAEMTKFTNHLTRLDDVKEEFYVYDRLHDAWIPFKYGDWIIKGTKDEFYPCEDSVFQEKYERVRSYIDTLSVSPISYRGDE